VDAPVARQISTYQDEFRLLTDVPAFVQWMWALAVAGEVGAGFPAETGVHPGELGLTVMRAALDDRLPADTILRRPWPAVAAMMLDPSVFPRIVQELVPSDGVKFRRLAGLLPEPAARVCSEIAFASEGAA
jgi:hypothetical protein